MLVEYRSKESFITYAKFNDIDDTTVDNKKDFFICIEPSGGPHCDPYFKRQHSNVITLKFDDVPEDTRKWGGDFDMWFEAKAMRGYQADELVKFIKTIPEDANVHVYCIKGQVRSKAVADFIKETLLNTDEQKPTVGAVNSYYYVKEMLRTTWTDT